MSNTRTDNFAVALAQCCIKFRWLILLAMVFCIVGLGNGLSKLEFSNSYRIFFSDANPELKALDNFLETYSKTDNVLFVIHRPDGAALNKSSAASLEELTEKAWAMPYATRVDSITNFQNTSSEDDDLIVENLIEEVELLSEQDIKQSEAVALKEPLLVGNLISDDGKTVGISVTFNLPEDDITALPKVVEEARALKAWYLEQQPDYSVSLSGMVMLNNAFSEASVNDLSTLVPGMYVLLIFMIVVVLRSFFGAIATLSVIGLSGLFAMGMSGYIGIPLSPVSVSAPTIIMTVAVADSIHILVAIFSNYRSGKTKHEAIIESVRTNLMPVTLTSLTTAIGFLSLNFSDAPPYWHLGNITALGIVAAWLLSLLFLPALIAILPLRKVEKKHSHKEAEIMGKVAYWVSHKRRPILVGGFLITLGLVASVPSIELSDEFVKYFSEDIEFRRDADFTAENLSGVYVLDFSVNSGEEEGINAPEYLNKLDDFVVFLKQQPEVKHVFAYNDIIKRLNKNMNSDNPDFYRIPESKELAGQYRLLYEFSLPFGMDLENRISFDKSETRATVIIDNISSVETQVLIDRIRVWQNNNFPEVMRSSPTGTSVMFTYISKRNIESMMVGNVIALLLISLIMLVVLRSPKLGFISLFANSLPIIMMFGVWALLVGKVGMVASTVAASTLGIVVDDTVHFLAKYQRAIRELGYDRFNAVRYTFETVGVAIVSTTVILIVGFCVLVFSDFQLNLQAGLMSAITIALALLFDFLILPAVLLIGTDKPEVNADKG